MGPNKTFVWKPNPEACVDRQPHMPISKLVGISKIGLKLHAKVINRQSIIRHDFYNQFLTNQNFEKIFLVKQKNDDWDQQRQEPKVWLKTIGPICCLYCTREQLLSIN